MLLLRSTACLGSTTLQVSSAGSTTSTRGGTLASISPFNAPAAILFVAAATRVAVGSGSRSCAGRQRSRWQLQLGADSFAASLGLA
jgi:hypothetical protein